MGLGKGRCAVGTRADFYIGRGPDAEWLGSIAWDGYPGGITPTGADLEPMYPGGPMHHKCADWPQGAHLFDATTETEYRERVARFFERRDDVTLPEAGWPWPWDDSNTTHYAYAFEGAKVWAFNYGWFDPTQPEPENYDEYARHAFPDMRARANVTLGPRSGLLVLGGGETA